MGRQDTRKGDPGRQQQGKTPPTLKSQRKMKPLLRASSLWTVGVPPYHATQDNDTLPLSPTKVQSRGITSLSLPTIKSASTARRITLGGLGNDARGGNKSRTDVHFSPTGTTAGMPLASDACPD